MKRRILTLTMLLLTAIITAEADPVDMRTAREVAVKFMNANTKVPMSNIDDLQLVTTYNISRGDAAFHIFNTPNGFIIVSADDCATPILGYSNEGRFDMNNIPIQLQDYLQGFVEQIEYGIENHLEADEETAQQWELVRATGSLSDNRSNQAVEPLITTIWGQSCYYNDLCPEDDLGDCGHVLTGCVATAMAQIMRYWGYPTNGGGLHTYNLNNYPQQTADFGATTYDWANMPDDLFDYPTTQTEINAVATLMWHCGVAVDMFYGPQESGAFSVDVVPALVGYFGYSDDLSLVDREDYSYSEWLAIIKNNLDLGYPVYYSGSDEGGLGGHAFVCDGYSTNNQLHFNWGWEGYCNGYYSLGALNPSIYAYNLGNDAIINIHPGCTSGTVYQVSAMSNLSDEGTVIGSGSYSCGESCTLMATPNEGYVFDHWTKDGEVVSYLPIYNLCVTETADYIAYFQQIDGIAVGDANSSNPSLPTYSKYSLTQQIYTADELGGEACEIMSVSFFNTTRYATTRNLTIYLVDTDKTAFESSTDWIPITEVDEMFSGSVTMLAKEWTTIYFNMPFNYDGLSNLVLTVDDNTNGWNNGRICCRTFDTDENQAICVSGPGPDFNPYNPINYTGTPMSVKNQIVFGFARYYPVTFLSNPIEGGTASGDVGPYYYGQSVALSATANENYVFDTWTKNDEIVSCFSTDNVPVTDTTEFVANFHQINGVAVGDAVSTNSFLPTNSYYSLTQQIYTAEELGTGACEITSVSFFNTGQARTRNFTIYLVNTDKTAFDSTTDWITVTEADQMFNGSVNMAAKSWNTIYFGTPFIYDGTSNVALIVDDNTCSNNNGNISCRTIATDETQAIRICGSSPNYDPGNPSGYSGTLMSEKNQVVFGFPNYNLTVTATANPDEGGTISGGEGLYYQGQTCTLTASANEGYCFYNWTVDGDVVSSDATYSFPVMGNMNLVANFGSPLNIIATANPEEGGVVSGGGSYGYSQTCTLSATHNNGYVFSKWTKNNTILSYLSNYSFTVTADAEYVADFQQVDGIVVGEATSDNPLLPTHTYYSYSLSEQIYTADELGGEACEISSVSFFNTGGYKYRTFTIYLVSTDKVAFENSSDWIPVTEADAVFSGTVTLLANSWKTITFSRPFSYDGSSNIALIIDDNSGSGQSGLRCRTFSTSQSQAIRVSSSEINYNPLDPAGYEGSLMSVKNQVIFGFPSYDYALSVSAHPEEGGTVSGSGMYYSGQSVSITATANEGYVFDCWTKNGYSYPVSCLSTYNVSINGNADYVANFHQVDGIAIGDAINNCYSLPSCSSFSMSQQIYTAEEINSEACEISSISFFYIEGFYKPRRFTVYLVSTDKTSFESNTDWITVTEADKVFSGNVTADGNGWMTLNFETLFSYDGFSNLALIIVDNTGIDYVSRNSRSFNTEESQAILVSGNGMIYDPYHPTTYEGTLMWEKNQVIFGNPSSENEYTVSVLANPEEGGSVSGSGDSYYYGQSVPITATANEGYVFNCWTKDYEVVSYLSSDHVSVMENSEYVADFQQMDGTIVGEATYNSYLLPTSNYHSYSLSQQIYTADELNLNACDISSISLFITGSYIGRELSIYVVHTDKNSFESNTDWIAVTEADQVYSGTCLFGYGWSTIYFSTPFAYDGTSNIAIVVNDKTGECIDLEWNWEWVASYRTFDADGIQAILCSDDESNLDPYNSSCYSGILMREKNEIVFGIASYEYMVSVSANPIEGGTVSGGGGMYFYGQPIPITATANEGYVFNYWTQNGWLASYYSSDMVSVTGNSEYVANFQQMDGIVVGEATSDNYYLPTTSYYYSLSEQIYTAGELNSDACEISSVSFFNTDYSCSREMTIYMVHTNKMSFEDEMDWIKVKESDMVFDGTVFMNGSGWSTICFNTPFAYDGFSNIALMVYDKTGEWSCNVSCRTYETGGTQAMYYEDSEIIDPYNLFGFEGFWGWGCFGTLLSEKNQVVFGTPPTTEEQTFTLSQGWNWISTYIDLNEVNGIAMLEEALGDYGVTIQTYNESADYFGDGEWSGLEDYEWTNAEMVMVEVSEDCTIDLAGPTVDPGTVEIEIHPGWNWIGFPVATETAIGVAMAGFEAEEEDAIQSNVDGTSDYLDEWVGDVLTLVPGQGYMYYSNSTEPKTLVFSMTAKGKSVFLRKRKE